MHAKGSRKIPLWETCDIAQDIGSCSLRKEIIGQLKFCQFVYMNALDTKTAASIKYYKFSSVSEKLLCFSQ